MTTPPTPRPRQRGQATIELIALLPLLAIVALLAVQVQLYVSTATAAENAARNAARVASDGGDAQGAARASLDPGLRDDLTAVSVAGEEVRVSIRVPLLSPSFASSIGTISRSATFAN